MAKFMVCVIAFLGLLVCANYATADLLTYDVLVSDVQADPDVHKTNDHLVKVQNVGDVVSLDLIAWFPNAVLTNPAGYGLKVGNLSVISNGGSKGNLSPAVLSASFTGTGKSAGQQADLDTDTDLDIGSNSTVAGANAAFVVLSSTNGSPPDFVPGVVMSKDVTGDVAPEEVVGILLGTMEYTVTDLAGALDPIIARERGCFSGSASAKNVHNFKYNGAGTLRGSITVNDPWGDVLDVGHGAGVTIGVVPEPSTLILLGMGCLALLAIRRRK
jgi:hypothetical protein